MNSNKNIRAYDFFLRERKVIDNFLNKRDFKIYLGKNLSTKNFFYLIFRSLTTQKIRDTLFKLLVNSKKEEVYNVIDENNLIKFYAIDYLQYIFDNKQKPIPFKYFPEEDYDKILQILKSYIWAAFFERIPLEVVGRKNVEEYIFTRRKYDTVRIRKGYFEFPNGFKNIFPWAELRDYGLGDFKNQCKICFDLGAFVGDTAFVINKIKKPQEIYAFEPDPDNMKILKDNLKLNNLEDKVITVPLATSSKSGYVYFQRLGGASSIVKEKGKERVRVKTITIDEFVAKENIKRVDLIKMDIEGAEFDTLKGAVKTLKRDKPDLIVTIYHKGEHFFEIPGWLKKTVPEYNLRFWAFNQASPIIERAVAASVRKI